MRYAFVFLSIVFIWVAMLIMAAVIPDFDILFAHRFALIMTVAVFVIGFRRKA